MQGNRSAIQLIGMIMSKETLDVNCALDLIQILNSSATSCRDIITIFEDIFKHQKSGKICVAVHVSVCEMQALEYFVKNCNINFHYAANRDSFQKRLLALLNRVIFYVKQKIRGKTSILKQLNSNTDNWCKIQAKVLYIIQLWYDAFILEESKYQHIINTYKILRKENVTFPPRSKNQKNLMYVQTESPIFDNIEQIARTNLLTLDEDQVKFNKKLAAMGLKHLQTKMDKNIEVIDSLPVVQKKPQIKKQVNIDEISQKIAIIQSTQNGTIETLKVIEEVKRAIQFGVVKPNEEAYWREIKTAAQKLVEEWEAKNEELVKQEEMRYLERKLGRMGGEGQKNGGSSSNGNKKEETNSIEMVYKEKEKQKEVDLLGGFEPVKVQEKGSMKGVVEEKKEVDLLDLF